MRLGLFGPGPDGEFVSDVVLVLGYRAELFGQPFSEALQEIMRGPSEWSVAERRALRCVRVGPEPVPVLN
jgi:hypothetical protein